MRLRMIVPLALGLAVAVSGPAYAMAPPQGPQTVVATESFEAPLAANWAVTDIGWPQPSPTVWGRVNNVHSGASGTYSLWCAGSPSYWPLYPEGSGSDAVMDLDLTNWYSATASFDYLMPSKGAADVFVVGWKTDADESYDAHGSFGLTTPTQWQNFAHSLTDATTRNLSRKAGELKFRWSDSAETALQYPTIGQGPAIDRVSVVGYRFGPVRQLGTSTSLGGIDLSWTKPLAATEGLAEESRSIEYRIWRRLEVSPSGPWVELTEAAAAPGVTSFGEYRDVDAEPGVNYVYRVVAYAVGSTTEYGEIREVAGRLPVAGGLDVVSQASANEIVSGDAVDFVYTITNTGASSLSEFSVVDVSGSISDPAIPAALAPGDSFVLSRQWEPTASAVNTVTVTAFGDVGTLVKSASRYVAVYHPSLTMSVSPSVCAVSSGKQGHWQVTVHNTGDAAVSDLVVKVQGTASGTLQGLQAGEAHSMPVSKAIASAGQVSLSVTGWATVAGVARAATAQSVSEAFVVPPRFNGATRAQTAVELSKAAFAGGANNVVIATAYGYADALSASALAASVGGPLLLVRSDGVPAEVLAELERLKATKAYVIGGTSAVGTAPENQLKAAGLAVDRVAGTTRYDTAAKVANQVKAGAGESTTVFLATGTNFPDALAASSLAAAMKAPIMLTRPTDLPAETLAALKSYAPSRVVVVGGTSAVSDGVLSTVRTQLGLSAANTPRLAGTTRYETAKKIIDWGRDTAGLAPDGIDGMYLASGTNYPDALAGGVFAAKYLGKWRPLMLTNPTTTEPVPEVQMLVSGNPSMSFISAIGGATALPEPLYQKALGYLP